MRGAVSLAAALAIPLHTDSGAPFPGRDVIVYLTFSVILGTLVLQGLGMPLVVRALGLEDDGVAEREAVKARIHAAEAALGRLEELAGEDWVRDDTVERMRGLYRFRQSRFAARFDDADDGALEQRSRDYQRLRSKNEAASTVDLVFMTGIIVGLVVVIIMRVRGHDIRWRRAATTSCTAPTCSRWRSCTTICSTIIAMRDPAP